MRALSSIMCVLVGLAAGCADSGDSDKSGSNGDIAQAKLEAKSDLGSGSAASSSGSAASSGNSAAPIGPDPCAKNAWYGDGECDSWCPTFDRADCSVGSGHGMVCAAFWSPADGKCDWTDPCGPVQDEDCGDVECATIWSAPDGKCDPSDPCSKVQDADCQGGGPICTKIWKPADGKCDLSDPCARLQDEDCQGGGSDGGVGCGSPVVCDARLYPTNGQCEARKGCEGNDPVDCRPETVVCTLIAYETNGKCEAPKGCEGNDPVDCAVACLDIAYATNGRCEAAPGCEANDPVDCNVVTGPACIEIAYQANGKCEAAPGCEYTDPQDCPVACRDILYPTNGKCEAAPGCVGSDPVDCKSLICPAIYIPADGACPSDQPCDPDCLSLPRRP